MCINRGCSRHDGVRPRIHNCLFVIIFFSILKAKSRALLSLLSQSQRIRLNMSSMSVVPPDKYANSNTEKHFERLSPVHIQIWY